MSRRTGIWMLAAAAVIGMGLVSYSFAQDAGGRNGGGQRPRGNGGGGGNFAQRMREGQLKNAKDALGGTEEEWNAIKPKIEKVQDASEDLTTASFMLRRAGRAAAEGQPAPQAPQPKTDLQKKAQELKKLLDNKDSKADEVKAALTAYRDARAKAKTDLEKAQKDLKDVLTVKQEAALVSQGLLE